MTPSSYSGPLPPLLVIAIGEALVHTAPHLGAQQAPLGLAGGQRERRHQVAPLEADVRALGDEQVAVAGRLPVLVGAERAHLARGS